MAADYIPLEISLRRPDNFGEHAALANPRNPDPAMRLIDLSASTSDEIKKWASNQPGGSQYFFIEPGKYGDVISLGDSPNYGGYLKPYLDASRVVAPAADVVAHDPVPGQKISTAVDELRQRVGGFLHDLIPGR